MPNTQWEAAHWVASHLSNPLKFREEWLEFTNHWTVLSQMEVLSRIAGVFSVEINLLNLKLKEAESESMKGFLQSQIKYYRSLLKASALKDLMFLLQSICLDAEDWDEADSIFPANNRLVDLKSGKDFEVLKELKISRHSRVNFDSNAKAPRWEQFIQEVTGGDQELAEYLQRAVGYSLSGLGTEQVLFILFGSGANGKNVFLELLYELFGSMAHQTNFSILEKAYRGDDSPGKASPHLAAFMGKRFVMASESHEGSAFNDGIIKSLTGDAHITARQLYSRETVFKNRAKIWVSCNNMPRVSDLTEGFWRRLHIIPFQVKFKESTRDKTLRDKLVAELPGILNWALTGSMLWYRDGLNAPKRIEEAVLRYRIDSDPVGGFLEEKCIQHPKVSSNKKVLFDGYKKFCKVEGSDEVLPYNKFIRAMEAKGFKNVKKENKWVFEGICLIDRQTEFLITQEDVGAREATE